ncbi:hypothetical protein M2466_000807 [Parabacteroides sp. PH5-26]|nr:hypothetical protein [Parabacteroides sp. PH5-26]
MDGRTPVGVPEMVERAAPLPRATLRLQGVIHL